MTTPSTKQLSETITEMDSASQTAFSEIATFAKMALESLEKPVDYADPERIAIVLKFIWCRALDAENHINAMAGDVGLDYVDKSMQRRIDARCPASKATSGEVSA